MPVAVNSSVGLVEAQGRGWWFDAWASPRVAAGVTDRSTDRSALRPQGSSVRGFIEAEQVHGASVAVIEHSHDDMPPIAGCDALLTRVPGIALLIRTADCLPIFFSDPARGVVGLAHVGWRGLAASLPNRVVALMHHVYRTHPADLHIAIGPAIRPCCYEVGEEFIARFGPFVREGKGRRTCDLIGVAVEQLKRCGVRPDRVIDSQRCTACDTSRWFSLRREGPSTGRLTSLIMLRS